jgi:hypothetical protein
LPKLVLVVKLILNMNVHRLGLAWITMTVSLLVDLLPSVAGASALNTDLTAPALLTVYHSFQDYKENPIDGGVAGMFLFPS